MPRSQAIACVETIVEEPEVVIVDPFEDTADMVDKGSKDCEPNGSQVSVGQATKKEVDYVEIGDSEITFIERIQTTESGEQKVVYECGDCGRTCHDKVSSLAHIGVHTDERPYQCEECGISFVVKELLTIHMRLHTGNNPLKCDRCDKSFLYMSKLKQHMKSHTGEKPFRCSHCDKSFASTSSLNVHMKSHTEEKLHQCQFCERAYSHRHKLTAHVKKSHRDRHKTTGNGALEHRVQKSDESVAICSMADFLECELNADNADMTGPDEVFVRTVEGDLHGMVKSEVGNTTLSCDVTDGDELLMSDVCDGQKPSELYDYNVTFPFKCDQCEKRYLNEAQLNNHINKSHSAGNVTAACQLSGLLFTQTSSLARHKKLHTGERPFVCDHCDKTFIDSNKLARHMKSHIGDKLYKCGQCEKAFSGKDKLYQHKQSHNTDQEPCCSISGIVRSRSTHSESGYCASEESKDKN